ncbi:MAG: alpha/beta hydrolase [Deltaproteobacteria bacterium]|nr:alpha/beta hydrolase [Myxococcales bacterium]MDP3215319.1 alpha/beta hydrolase [Deltaproteobacteria bacterium]
MTALVDRRVAANGLQHHLVEHPGGGRGDVVLLHGYLDLARSFEEVIAGLGAAGYRVIAPDFRGHGDTDRVPPGAYYHAMDYVADLDALLDALALDRPHLVAHSMGGTVATRYAGARPARVASLALIEGVGPPAMPAEVTPDRTALWLDGLKRARGRATRPMRSLDEVVARMRVSHPSVPLDTLRTMAARATRETDDGGLLFRFDPLHMTISPMRYDAEAFEAFVPRITAPVLMVDGGSLAHFPELAERAARYPGARFVSVPDAGHMIHWTAPDALVAALLAFLDEQPPAG